MERLRNFPVITKLLNVKGKFDVTLPDSLVRIVSTIPKVVPLPQPSSSDKINIIAVGLQTTWDDPLQKGRKKEHGDTSLSSVSKGLGHCCSARVQPPRGKVHKGKVIPPTTMKMPHSFPGGGDPSFIKNHL